jgi:hypothetical protein
MQHKTIIIMNNNNNNKDDEYEVRRVLQRSPESFFSLVEATDGSSLLPFMTSTIQRPRRRRSSSSAQGLSPQDLSRIIDMALAIAGIESRKNLRGEDSSSSMERQPKQ